MLGLIFKFLLIGIAFAEEPMLSNIVQLTSPEIGFKKAGEAYFSPEGNTISFQGVAEGEEDFQIYTMDVETREVRRISQGKGACTCSFFKPDGTKIIFGQSSEKAQKSATGSYRWDLTPYMNIYESNLDGTDLRKLTDGSAYHAECAYSPDGKLIVFASNEEGSMNIYVMNTDGTEVHQLTHTNHCYNGGPFFSPDGKKIVFRADRVVPNRLQIYIMDVTGENEMQLTKNEAVNWAPFWHPSGRYINFTTSLLGHHNYQVFLFDIETQEQFQVTDHPGFNGLATFNSEGTKMLWTSKRGEDGSSQIFMADFILPKTRKMEEKL